MQSVGRSGVTLITWWRLCSRWLRTGVTVQDFAMTQNLCIFSVILTLLCLWSQSVCYCSRYCTNILDKKKEQGLRAKNKNSKDFLLERKKDCITSQKISNYILLIRLLLIDILASRETGKRNVLVRLIATLGGGEKVINVEEGFSGGVSDTESVCHAGDTRDASLIPGLGRSSEGGHGNPLQYFAWRIPWTGELDRLQSRGLHGVRHVWSDLACSTCNVEGERRKEYWAGHEQCLQQGIWNLIL